MGDTNLLATGRAAARMSRSSIFPAARRRALLPAGTEKTMKVPIALALALSHASCWTPIRLVFEGAMSPIEFVQVAIEQQRHFRLVTGRIGPEEYGGNYDRDVKDSAKERIFRNMAQSMHTRVPGLCGVTSWERIDERLGPNSKLSPELKASFRELLNGALDLHADVLEYADLSWERGGRLETWTEGDAHDRCAWSAVRTDPNHRGRLRMSTSTRIGPHSFVLAFDSTEFPELEAAIGEAWTRRSTYLRKASRRR